MPPICRNCGMHHKTDVACNSMDAQRYQERIRNAAPELLEALELLLYGAECVSRNGLTQPQINGGIIMARAAIAKAKGE